MKKLPRQYRFAFSNNDLRPWHFDNGQSVTCVLTCNYPKTYWTSDIRVWRNDGTSTVYVPKNGNFALSYKADGVLQSITFTGGNQTYPHEEAESYDSQRYLLIGLELDVIHPTTLRQTTLSANVYCWYNYPRGTTPVPWTDIFDVQQITI